MDTNRRCGHTAIKAPHSADVETPANNASTPFPMSSIKSSYAEQDNVTFSGPNELPSYDELAAHNGPNSRHVLVHSKSLMTNINEHRFGRWRGWIEKR
jgi:hypothetical protein